MIDEDEEYGLRCTVRQLESERDGYAGELTRMSLEVGLLRKKNVKLLHTNDKLRELVRDMHKALFSLNLDHCQACPREDTCVFIHECAFERDMRELGVEVDE